MTRLQLGLLGLLFTACPGPSMPCKSPLWGTPDQPAELDIGLRSADGGFLEVRDGDEVDLEFPIQGGHVFFIGARLRNMVGCKVDVTARVRNPLNNEQFAYETRQIVFGTDGGTGLIPKLEETSNAANIPMCPNYTHRDLVGQDWNLEVTATDVDGRRATATRRVRPVCRQANASERATCLCECQADYFFGKCTPDGGP